MSTSTLVRYSEKILHGYSHVCPVQYSIGASRLRLKDFIRLAAPIHVFSFVLAFHSTQYSTKYYILYMNSASTKDVKIYTLMYF